ncbi:hypothetical protein HK104_002189 [Borealophlyctis nickersoniae]|nr:hypothetical protein HK104_002189 [Borealophlyctis nickersoniae]
MRQGTSAVLMATISPRSVSQEAQICAPELFTFYPKYTKECDVFSYGITLTELFTMAGPYGINFNTAQLETLVELVKSGKRPVLPSVNDIPDDLLNLVQDCWAHDPKQRPPFSVIVARLDISGPAPVYVSSRDELCFTSPSHPPQSSRNNGQNTTYDTPVTASGSGRSAYSTQSSSSPVISKFASTYQCDSAASDVASLTQQLHNLKIRLRDLSKKRETLEDKIDNEKDPIVAESLQTRLNNYYLREADLRAERTRVREQMGRLSPAAEVPTPPKSASPSSSENAASTVNPTDPEKLYEMGRALDSNFAEEEGRNNSAAFEWYHKAAMAGHPASQIAVGYNLLHGLGIEKNAAKAAEWFQKAADQGNPEGQHNLAICYRNGLGVGSDPKMADGLKAAKWYKRAAEQGDAGAQNNLGYCYRNGTGVGRDKRKAAEWYKMAADQGDALGQFNLGFCYHNGFGVTKNKTRAVEWYKKAAEQGNAGAQNSLGNCYQNGTGVGRDKRKAAEWYKLAAEQGDAVGQYNLGFCYHRGIGVAKDKTKAVEWYRKAAAQGYTKAVDALAEPGMGVKRREARWYTAMWLSWK